MLLLLLLVMRLVLLLGMLIWVYVAPFNWRKHLPALVVKDHTVVSLHLLKVQDVLRYFQDGLIKADACLVLLLLLLIILGQNQH